MTRNRDNFTLVAPEVWRGQFAWLTLFVRRHHDGSGSWVAHCPAIGLEQHKLAPHSVTMAKVLAMDAARWALAEAAKRLGGGE